MLKITAVLLVSLTLPLLGSGCTKQEPVLVEPVVQPVVQQPDVQPTSTPATMKMFKSVAFGYSFDYPLNFETRIQPKPPAPALEEVHIFDPAQERPPGFEGEGPPTLFVLAYTKPAAQTLIDFLQEQNSWTSFDKDTSVFTQTAVDQKTTLIRYPYDGLYGGEAMVLARGSQVFLLKGDSSEEGDKYEKAFLLVSDSFRLPNP